MTFGARHLVEPGRFPRSFPGEPCGSEVVALELAGTTFVLEGLDGERALGVRRRYEGWLAHSCSAEPVVTRVVRASDADFLPFPGPGEEITTDVRPEHDGAALCGPCWMGRIVSTPALGGTLSLPPCETSRGGGAIENYLRFLVGHALLREGGVIVHSAAVVEQGEVHLFPAASGSGKTTLSRMSLAEGRTVLSDDMNVLLRRHGRTFVAQVPFTGDFSRRKVAGGPFPLASINRLRKGPATGVAPLGRTEALGLLFAEIPSLNSDPYRHDLLWDALESLVDGAALRTLTFSLCEPLWPRIAAAETADAA